MANHKPLERVAVRAVILELHRLRNHCPMPEEFTNSLVTLVLDMITLSKAQKKRFDSMSDAVVQVMIRLKLLETGETDGTGETENTGGLRV